MLTLVIAVVTAFTVSYYYESQLSEAKKEIEILGESEELKEDEILELKSELKTTSENLMQREDLIFNLNNELEKMQGKIENLKEKNEDLKEKNESLKKELGKYESLRKLNIVATAYDAYCNTGCIGKTATGVDVSNTVYKDGHRVVAVDPNVIPLGSLMHVEAETMSFVGIAEDTGGDIKGRRIDVLMKNRDIAYDFGRQDVKVTVLREGRG